MLAINRSNLNATGALPYGLSEVFPKVTKAQRNVGRFSPSRMNFQATHRKSGIPVVFRLLNHTSVAVADINTFVIMFTHNIHFHTSRNTVFVKIKF